MAIRTYSSHRPSGNGQIRFLTKFASWEMDHLTLPVEVRRADLSLVARTVTSERVENLAPGLYHVTAFLPTGLELTTSLEVPEQEESPVVEAILEPDPEDASPNETSEVPLFLGLPDLALYRSGAGVAPAARRQAPSGGLESLGGEDALHLLVRRFRGVPLPGGDPSRAVRLETNLPWDFEVREEAGLVVLRLGSLEETTSFLQILESGAAPVNVALPLGGSDDDPVQAIFRYHPRGDAGMVGGQEAATASRWYTVDFHTSNVEADALLRYRAGGYLQQAAAAVDAGAAVTAEKLLRRKRRDQVAAAIGAYTLLRLNELDRLHDWTGNLDDWFPWLPDGAAIRGEHLAREGEHREALDAFLGLAGRGLPIFSEGFSYALDRLTLYVDVATTEEGRSVFAPEAVQRAEILRTSLLRLAPFIDHSRPFLTFAGAAPDRPGAETLSEADLTTGDFMAGAFELTPHLVPVTRGYRGGGLTFG
jgi:hypothetical protein